MIDFNVREIFIGRVQNMDNIIALMETLLLYTVEICTVILELFGVCVLLYTAVRCFMKWVKNDHSEVRLTLAQGIALALEFKMGGEVLRTVVVREWSELGILGAIIALRVVLTFVIHWEIKNEKQELEEAAGNLESI